MNRNDMCKNKTFLYATQLLQMAQATDLKEEGSRRHFIAAMKKLLVAIETPDELLEGSIKALLFAHQEETDFLQTISDVISELSTRYTSREEGDGRWYFAKRVDSSHHFHSRNYAREYKCFHGIRLDSSRLLLLYCTRNHESSCSCSRRRSLVSWTTGNVEDGATVLEEFKPLLLSVASNQDEKLEIRAQAIMAICDLIVSLFGNARQESRWCLVCSLAGGVARHVETSRCGRGGGDCVQTALCGTHL